MKYKPQICQGCTFYVNVGGKENVCSRALAETTMAYTKGLTIITDVDKTTFVSDETRSISDIIDELPRTCVRYMEQVILAQKEDPDESCSPVPQDKRMSRLPPPPDVERLGLVSVQP